MSRIGNRIIQIPNGVTVTVTPTEIQVKGKLGNLNIPLPANQVLSFSQDTNNLKVARINDLKQSKMLHGTYNALIKNAVNGVDQGFSKQLQLVGVGYRAAIKDNEVVLSLGYSHPINIKIPNDLKVTVEKNTIITITGPDKQHVGEFAMQIRKWRLPEPYKGKGVLYVNEHIIRKAGKTAEGKK